MIEIQQIKEVLSAVIDVPLEEIMDDASMDELEAWDSLAHMNLVIALEEEFEILFTDDQIIEMLNFKLVCEITKEVILNK